MTLSELRKKLAKARTGEIAALSGLSSMTVGRIRSAKHAPNMDTFERLCKALDGKRSPPKRAEAR